MKQKGNINFSKSSSHHGPLVYRALVSQSSTSAPTATVLENTLGVDLTFNYLDVGVYSITTASQVFPQNKTALPPVNATISMDGVSTAQIMAFTWNATDDLRLQTATIDLPGGSLTLVNGILLNSYLEILVY